MESINTLVSFRTSPAQKELIKNGLSGFGNVVFLNEVDSGEARSAAIRKADVILTWNAPKEFSKDEYAMMENARFMQLLSAGADHIPFELLPKDLTVAGNVGAYAKPMAEHAMAMALALAKNLRRGHERLAQGNFDQFSMNKSLDGAVCAILGFGGIGKATARLMKAFGAKVYAINTSGKTDEKVDFIGTLNDLEFVLKNADFIVISLPLSKATTGLIGARELGWMKPDAILVNVARGDIIDEGAFYTFLKDHPDFKAGLDAWWVEPFRYNKFEIHYPFFDLPNVLGSPHNSGMVPEALDNAVRDAVQNLTNFLAGGPVHGIMRPEDYV